MKILGIETSTQMGGVALIDGTKLVAEYRLALPLQHGEKLLPLIDTLLKDTRMALSDLSAIAISIGPGSYTGLRVGLATAKGLAMAHGLPLLPVSTLLALATPFQFLKMMIVPMIISRKEELFWGLFAPSKSGQAQEGLPLRDDGALIRLHPDSVSSLQEALDTISQEWKCQSESNRSLRNEILFIGDGALLYRDQILKYFQRGNGTLFASRDQLPLASSVAQLGLLQLMKGDVPPSSDVVPLYLSRFKPNVQGEPCLA